MFLKQQTSTLKLILKNHVTIKTLTLLMFNWVLSLNIQAYLHTTN